MARTYASVKDMAIYYRMSQSTVRNKVRSGQWPAERIPSKSGKRSMIRFSPEQQDEIDQMIRSGSTRSTSLDWLDDALDKISA
jgi:hypothetical protein